MDTGPWGWEWCEENYYLKWKINKYLSVVVMTQEVRVVSLQWSTATPQFMSCPLSFRWINKWIILSAETNSKIIFRHLMKSAVDRRIPGAPVVPLFGAILTACFLFTTSFFLSKQTQTGQERDLPPPLPPKLAYLSVGWANFPPVCCIWWCRMKYCFISYIRPTR